MPNGLKGTATTQKKENSRGSHRTRRILRLEPIILFVFLPVASYVYFSAPSTDAPIARVALFTIIALMAVLVVNTVRLVSRSSKDKCPAANSSVRSSNDDEWVDQYLTFKPTPERSARPASPWKMVGVFSGLYLAGAGAVAVGLQILLGQNLFGAPAGLGGLVALLAGIALVLAGVSPLMLTATGRIKADSVQFSPPVPLRVVAGIVLFCGVAIVAAGVVLS